MANEDRLEIEEIDESSWVYLSAADTADVPGLREHMIEACEASGWATVTRSYEERVGRGSDPGRFFEGVRDAVSQADIVVTIIGVGGEMSEAELTLAYSHGRPVIGVQVAGEHSSPAGIQTMLREYERGRVITCGSAEECATGLREALADPAFAKTVREAG